MESGLYYLDKLCTRVQLQLTSLLMGPVCLISQGRFEEPFRPGHLFSTVSLAVGCGRWNVPKCSTAHCRDTEGIDRRDMGKEGYPPARPTKVSGAAL